MVSETKDPIAQKLTLSRGGGEAYSDVYVCAYGEFF